MDQGSRFLLAMVLTGVASQAAAHGGGLNAEGCHHNRRSGDYHCHRAQTAPSQQLADPGAGRATAGSGQRQALPSPGDPTCHVGPRGGTYTITSSGGKNYAGC